MGGLKPWELLGPAQTSLVPASNLEQETTPFRRWGAHLAQHLTSSSFLVQTMTRLPLIYLIVWLYIIVDIIDSASPSYEHVRNERLVPNLADLPKNPNSNEALSRACLPKDLIRFRNMIILSCC